MASNITLNTLPYIWSSANDDIIYTFGFDGNEIDTVTNDGGYVKIILITDFNVTPIIGQYVYIDSNIYIGTFKVLAVYGTDSVVIETSYISGITTYIYKCYHLRVPNFSVYKGSVSDTNLPYTKVVDIKPSVLYDNLGIPYLSINIKGVTKYLFKILSNTIANSVDYSMFNFVNLSWDGINTSDSKSTIVLNSAITNEELIKNYATDGIYLTPINKPLIATSGITFASYMGQSALYPTIHKFINGVKQ